MQKVCLSCHSRPWVEGHFERFETRFKNQRDELAATNVLLSPGKRSRLSERRPFQRSDEKRWVEQWLFYATPRAFLPPWPGPTTESSQTGDGLWQKISRKW